MAVDSTSVEGTSNGRISEGSVFVCAHGQRKTRHLIVDWQPFDEMTFEDSGIPGLKHCFTIALAATGSGTRITLRSSESRGPMILRNLGTLFLRTFVKRVVTKASEAFVSAIRCDVDAGLVASQGASSSPDAAEIIKVARESLAGKRSASDP